MKTTVYRYIMKGLAMSVMTLLLFSCHQDELGEHLQHAKVDIPSDGRIMFNVGVSDNVEITRGAANCEQSPIALTGGKQKLWLIPTVEPTAARDNEVTRGTQLTPTDKMSSFGVSAFKHASSEYNLADCRPDFFYNQEATEILDTNNEGTGVWQLAKTYYWPDADEALTFNAYYPYGNDNVKLVDLNEETKLKGAQRFNVTVASNGKEQVDFMTATTDATPDESFKDNAKPGINLTFNHHMTAIRFVLGDQFLGGYIKSISFSGIYGSGVYTVGSGWTTSEQDKTNDVNINYVSQDDIQQTHMDKPIDGTAGQAVTAAGETFLLIPQTFASTDAAKISILFNDGYDDYTVEASLAGQDPWVEGTTVTYAISSHYLTTLRISELTFPTTVAGAPKTTWAVGDKVGMYVVAPNGTTIEHENVCCEFVGGTGFWKWQVNHPDGNPVYKLPGYSYYFYYPYVDGAPNGYTILGHQAGEDAETFFSGVLSSYSTIADQSTTDKFINADLQIAKGIDDVRSSTVRATMLRQVGLVRMTFPSKSITTTKTYLNNVQTSVDGTTDVTASRTFESGTNTPCPNGDVYYFWTKAGSPTMFNISSGVNSWASSLNVTLSAYETSSVNNIYGRRYNWGAVNYVYNYDCQKAVKEFIAPEAGNYVLQVWGAEGGVAWADNITRGGLGGYSTGSIVLENSQKLYVCVGGHGIPQNRDGSGGSVMYYEGGYNGGGGTTTGPSGGGCTHIAKSNNRGVLANYNSYRSEVLIVAGGGGGSERGLGGNGGGLSGENGNITESSYISQVTRIATGGSQNAGGGYGTTQRDGNGSNGSFGQGGSGDGPTSSDGAGGGGGGWYGGGGITFVGGGGGGSGYIGGVNNGSMQTGARYDDGYARITLTR